MPADSQNCPRRRPPPDPGVTQIATFTKPRPAGLSCFWSRNPMAKSKVATTEKAPSNVTSISAGQKSRATAAGVAAEANDQVRWDAERHVVVFGLDDGGKAHASWFGGADAELAIKAAGLMGYHVLPITTDDHRAAASGLAAGRVFASGKGFVPFAKMAAYEALRAFGEAYQPPAPVEAAPEPAPAVTSTPQRWEDLAVGSLVLASLGADEGWFEAVVIEARGEAIFVLRWQGWPEDAAFVRRADGLALLPEQSAVAPAAP